MDDKEKNQVRRIGPLRTAGNILREAGRVYRECRRGTITTADAQRCVNMLAMIRQMIQGDDHDRRLAVLEEAAAARRGGQS